LWGAPIHAFINTTQTFSTRHTYMHTFYFEKSFLFGGLFLIF
jgi:hypothetical protein